MEIKMPQTPVNVIGTRNRKEVTMIAKTRRMQFNAA